MSHTDTINKVRGLGFTCSCIECERVFDLLNEIDAQEWVYGHDCKVFLASFRCSCTVNLDGTTTTVCCSVHANNDPCHTMADMTGKRRQGSIVRGRCSHCGWTGVAQ